MVSLKKVLLLFAVILFTVNPFRSVAEEAQSHGETSSAEEINAHIQHHLKDDYYFNFFTNSKTGKSFGFPLPVILIDGGLKVFSSAEFDHGNKVVEKDGNYYKLYHSKIYKTDAAGTITYDDKHHPTNAKPWDFSITKNVLGLILAALLLFIAFTSLAKTYKNGPNVVPKGLGRALEPLVLYVRDEMAVPNIGHRYKEFMPYLLSVFFLIFLLNLLGLTPLGLNVTGNISVTLCLALFTFVITNFKANKDYWKHIFWMPGVPVPFKFVLAPIEVLGMFTKPFSLMVRLFANITAGHTVVMGLIAVVYLLQHQLTVAGSVSVSLLLTLLLFFLELLVAFLQAFIFTMLSSLFIGMAVEEHAHH
ncbi:F0F1 ATP synthase subunit A [Sphingobacterium daejeonense]|jgi:F-type H+-transporting ATPase subunit a|uniref:ATP synthase subunit a n=1 Tax=Sphingobacterium daejeonense TaxID=371142 RepID=A0ABW3RII8_9SPHI|nr:MULTISPECIES: F0F1 ATP synthase subunit A [Sphingobacterium]MCT1532923.1 F0F1 ATP synthase subunit A [Sphingobacterium daejeonense]